MLLVVREQKPDLSGWRVREEITANVPNFSPVFNVDVGRSTGVQRSLLANVENGYLKRYDLSKDSEAISMIEVPIALAKDIASIFPAMVGIDQSRTDNLNKLAQSRQALYAT